MAQVFKNDIAAPDFMEPDGKFSHSGYEARCAKYREDTIEWLRGLGFKHKHLGKVIAFPVADGAAQYMVATPTKLIHLEEVDAYAAHPALLRGLRAKDVTDMIDSQARLDALFGRKV